MSTKYYDRILQIAEAQKMTMRELAKRANVGENTIYKWNKSSPQVSSLQRVAKALNVSIFYIIGDDPLSDMEKELLSRFRRLEIMEQVKIIGDIVKILEGKNGKF